MDNTLHKKCQSEDYRKTLSNRFGWFGTICSVDTAMLLTAVNALDGVNTINVASLLKACTDNGMTRDEIQTAFRELYSLDAVDFFRTTRSEVVVRFTVVADAEETLNLNEALLAA